MGVCHQTKLSTRPADRREPFFGFCIHSYSFQARGLVYRDMGDYQTGP